MSEGHPSWLLLIPPLALITVLVPQLLELPLRHPMESMPPLLPFGHPAASLPPPLRSIQTAALVR